MGGFFTHGLPLGLDLSSNLVAAAQELWKKFLGLYSSKIAAGEAIYSNIFDANPSLQGAFKSPKAVLAERFVSGLCEAWVVAPKI